MKHPRQNITLKIYSVSDDTANRLMTALGKLLHSRRFIRKAERWKLFRSTPPLFTTNDFLMHIRMATGQDYPRVGHQMTIAERRQFQAGYLRTLNDPAFAGMLDDAEILWRFRTLGLYKFPRTGRIDSSKPNEANKPKSLFIGVDFARSDEVTTAIRKVIRDDIMHQPRVRTNAIAGQNNTRGLR